MTPPPDPVAALAEALHKSCEAGWERRAANGAVAITMHGADAHRETATIMLPALTAAGWSLSHDSERRSAVIGSERSDNEALVAAVKRLPLFDESDLITAMNGTVRSPRTIADYVEGYRNRVLAVIESGR